MTREPRDRVVVIAEPKAPDGDRYRHCFWEDLYARHKPKEYSIHDDKPTAADLYTNTRLLVISWDSANGDPFLKSDITLQYLETQARVRIHEMMTDGGIVFAECQTAQGVPVQKSYDAIFGAGQVKVTTDVAPEPERRGPNATIVGQFADHPVLLGMPRMINEQPIAGRLFYNRINDKGSDPGTIFDKYPDSLWFGWFTEWTKGWIPLLYADLPQSYLRKNGRRAGPAPVLLAKVERNGLQLASTLWASAARCDRLISNIVDAPLPEVRAQHRRIIRTRVTQDFSIGLLLAILLIVVLRLLIELAIAPNEWVLSVAGVGFISVSLAAWNWFTKYVWRRPIGVNIVKSMVRGFHRKSKA
jgi:hypothetical protein